MPLQSTAIDCNDIGVDKTISNTNITMTLGETGLRISSAESGNGGAYQYDQYTT
jgi:hypothetical protein